MTHKFTKDEIIKLAACERAMDSGAIPFVVLGEGRVICPQACMDEFELKHGQTINHAIFMEILKWNLADCQAKIDEQKLRETE